VVDLARVSAHEKGLWLRVEQDLAQPCWVQGDPARLRQVLLNLTGNAIKFTDHGGVTISSTRNAQGDAAFEVRDSGPGVPEADRERIFHAFEQLDGGFARRHGGTGLGLTISRELTHAMGGDLLCLPALGTGAAFRVRLRLPGVAAPAPAAAPGAQNNALRGSVLLAEDNAVNAIVAEAVLQRLGLVVKLVTDGHQAVAQAAAGGFDVVLMDCHMPGLDGYEATARIRQHELQHHLRRLPIVALTANALEGDRERSLAAGMDDHLAKPFREEDLVATLRRYLVV
jgi:two-component system, sensor histidine kinase